MHFPQAFKIDLWLIDSAVAFALQPQQLEKKLTDLLSYAMLEDNLQALERFSLLG